MNQPNPPRPPQGQPMYAAYPPQGAPAPQPPKKKPITKRWWFWVIVVFVGIGVISRMGGGNNQAASTSAATSTPVGQDAQNQPAQTQAAQTQAAQTQAPAKKAETPLPGLNTPVKDGDVEFTVTDYACDVTVKDAIQTLEPQGKFCRLKLSAKNVGKDQVTLSDSNIKLMDAGGAEYKSSSETWMVEGSMFLKKINPGNTLNGVVIIDVPKEVNPVTAVVSGGYFTKGAKVKVA